MIKRDNSDWGNAETVTTALQGLNVILTKLLLEQIYPDCLKDRKIKMYFDYFAISKYLRTDTS